MKNQFLPINFQIDLLSLLSGKEQGSLESIVPKTYNKQECIYRIGEAANEVYIVKSGKVKIGKNNKNKKTIIKSILTVGELFGEASLIGEGARVDFAIAMEKTELYALGLQEFYQKMRYQNNLGSFILNLLGTRTIEVERKIESFLLKNSRTRIIEFICELAEKKGQKIGYEILIPSSLTHQEIAEMTATSRQNVTAILNEVRNKNILIFNRRKLLIRDLELLKAEAY